MKIKNIVLPIGIVVAVVVLVEVQKQRGFGGCAGGRCFFSPAPQEQPSALPDDTPSAAAEKPLPLLVDLGSAQCIPCKMMKPTLDDFMANYADRFETRFIDVNQDMETAQRYGIRMIPTQIFFDADGNELFRHEGFISKEDILAKWEELGIQL